MIANKSGEMEQKISMEEGMKLASEIDFEFMEVSAKNNYNIDEMFQKAVDRHLTLYYDAW